MRSNLSVMKRQTILDRYMDGTPKAQIAREEKCSLSSVYNVIRGYPQTLKERMGTLSRSVTLTLLSNLEVSQDLLNEILRKYVEKSDGQYTSLHDDDKDRILNIARNVCQCFEMLRPLVEERA